MIADRWSVSGGVASDCLVTDMRRGWRGWLRLRWPLAALLVVLLAGDLETARGLPFARPLWDVLLPGAVLLGLAVAAGWYLRGRDNEQARVTRAAVAAVQQRERVGLARELHDVVAHYIGGMVVQAQAAQVVAGTDPGAAARVLPAVEGAGAEALSAMRRMGGAPRGGGAEGGERGRTPALTTELTADP